MPLTIRYFIVIAGIMMVIAMIIDNEQSKNLASSVPSECAAK